MKKENNPLVLCLFGILPVVWLGLLIAPAAHGGLPEIVARFPAVMNDPFHIELCGDSLKTVLILLCAYGLTVGVILSSRRNYRRGEEHGSAKWGSARTVNRKYRAAAPEENKIFTQNVRMGLDGRKHRRNLNTVVVGGSGAGKTRFYAKPNLCQANTSFTVLDPKGELLRSTGHLLRQKGYEVRVLDLLNMEKSHCYNPFVYLRDDNDVQRLVTNLFKNPSVRAGMKGKVDFTRLGQEFLNPDTLLVEGVMDADLSTTFTVNDLVESRFGKIHSSGKLNIDKLKAFSQPLGMDIFISGAYLAIDTTHQKSLYIESQNLMRRWE